MSQTIESNSSGGRTPEEQAVWDAAVQASAEQRPDDPPPRYFIEELDVQLTPGERVQVAIQCADLRDEIDDFDIKTKADAAARKAERAKLLAHAKDLQSQTRTGRTRRKVRCAEFTSFQQNRKYRVRLDRKGPDGKYEEIGETPLSTAERQGKLPLENAPAPEVGEDAEDGIEDYNLEDDDDDGNDDGDDGLEPEVDEAAPKSEDSTSNITDPDLLMSGAETAADAPAKSAPSVAPIKRSSSKKKQD